MEQTDSVVKTFYTLAQGLNLSCAIAILNPDISPKKAFIMSLVNNYALEDISGNLRKGIEK